MLLEDSVDEGYDGQNIHFNAELIDYDSKPRCLSSPRLLRLTSLQLSI